MNPTPEYISLTPNALEERGIDYNPGDRNIAYIDLPVANLCPPDTKIDIENIKKEQIRSWALSRSLTHVASMLIAGSGPITNRTVTNYTDALFDHRLDEGVYNKVNASATGALTGSNRPEWKSVSANKQRPTPFFKMHGDSLLRYGKNQRSLHNT